MRWRRILQKTASNSFLWENFRYHFDLGEPHQGKASTVAMTQTFTPDWCECHGYFDKTTNYLPIPKRPVETGKVGGYVPVTEWVLSQDLLSVPSWCGSQRLLHC